MDPAKAELLAGIILKSDDEHLKSVPKDFLRALTNTGAKSPKRGKTRSLKK